MGGICSQNSKTIQAQSIMHTMETQPDCDGDTKKYDITQLIQKPEDMPGLVTKKQKKQAVNAERPHTNRKYSDIYKPDLLYKSESQLSLKSNSKQQDQNGISCNNQQQQLEQDLWVEDNQLNDIQEQQDGFINEEQNNANNKLIPDDDDKSHHSTKSHPQQLHQEQTLNNQQQYSYQLEIPTYYTESNKLENQNTLIQDDTQQTLQFDVELGQDQQETPQQILNNTTNLSPCNFIENANVIVQDSSQNDVQNQQQVDLITKKEEAYYKYDDQYQSLVELKEEICSFVQDDTITQHQEQQVNDVKDSQVVIQEQQEQDNTNNIIEEEINDTKQIEEIIYEDVYELNKQRYYDNELYFNEQYSSQQIEIHEQEQLLIQQLIEQEKRIDEELAQLALIKLQQQIQEELDLFITEYSENIIEDTANNLLKEITQQTLQQIQLEKEEEERQQQIQQQILLEQKLQEWNQVFQEQSDDFIENLQKQLLTEAAQESLYQVQQELEDEKIRQEQILLEQQRQEQLLIELQLKEQQQQKELLRQQQEELERQQQLQQEVEIKLQKQQKEEEESKNTQANLEQYDNSTKLEYDIDQRILTEPFSQDNDLIIEEKENDEFFKQIDAEDQHAVLSGVDANDIGLQMKVSLIELDEEDKKVDIKMKEDEEQLKMAETNLTNYVQKWSVKTIELNLGQKMVSQSQACVSNNGAGIGDGQSSTYEESNYDLMSEYSEAPHSARTDLQNQGSPSTVILRKKTTRKRFPLKKKKVISQAGSIIEGQQQQQK